MILLHPANTLLQVNTQGHTGPDIQESDNRPLSTSILFYILKVDSACAYQAVSVPTSAPLRKTKETTQTDTHTHTHADSRKLWMGAQSRLYLYYVVF